MFSEPNMCSITVLWVHRKRGDDEGPFLALDIETTGTDPWDDRIVATSLVEVDAGLTQNVQSWLLNPGVPILSTCGCGRCRLAGSQDRGSVPGVG
jgi:DNA polymerase III epsilon subunit-like protein